MSNNTLKFVVICFFTAFFVGCSKFWYNQDKTFVECKRDCRDCRIEAETYIEDDGSLNTYKIKYEESCMKEKGYRLVPEKSLPLRARRRPADVFYGEKFGIAGKLELDALETTELEIAEIQ